MKTLLERIDAAYAGQNPRACALYLGTREHRELHDLCRRFAVIKYQPHEEVPTRTHYRGMPVYQVNADSYLAFGGVPVEEPSPCS